MNNETAVTQLAALAQATRLAVFRLLVEQGPEGLPAGRIGEQLDIPPATLSFHLKELAAAGLASHRQDGRFVIYTANFKAMDDLLSFLTKNCCAGTACEVSTATCSIPAAKNKREPQT